MPNRLRWVIARVPFDAAKLWGKRGQIKIQGDINGYAFGATLFPDGRGGHFLLVNKKMLRGGKTRPDFPRSSAFSRTQFHALLLLPRKSCCMSWDGQSDC
jgi:hypothetical protein